MNKIVTTALLLATSTMFATQIGLNIGSSNMDYETSNVSLGTTPDKNLRNYEIFGTVEGKLPKALQTYLSYTQNRSGTIENQFVLVGANKEYGVGKGKLYAGIVGGFGELKWKYNPINGTTSDATANSLIVGVQGGGKYDLSDTLFVNVNGKYLKHNYGADFNGATKIEHKTSSSIALGVGYKF